MNALTCRVDSPEGDVEPVEAAESVESAASAEPTETVDDDRKFFADVLHLVCVRRD